jgi:hypothetical protein
LKLFALILGFTIGFAASAHAAGMPIVAQPLVYTRDGEVQGCGARLTGGEAGAGAASEWFDVSFNVFRGGLALAQSYAYELKRSAYGGDARPARVPVQSAWLKAQSGGARLGENLERRDTLVYRLVLDDALALFRALAAGDSVTVGIKRWGESAESVYAGKPQLTEDARIRIASCLAALAP